MLWGRKAESKIISLEGGNNLKGDGEKNYIMGGKVRILWGVRSKIMLWETGKNLKGNCEQNYTLEGM